MSFWHAPIFGTGPKTPPRPASEAAVRCARIRNARSIEQAPYAMAGFLVGKLVWIGSLLVAAMLANPVGAAATAGPGAMPTLPVMIVGFVKAGKGIGLDGLVFIAVIIAFIAAFPGIARWTFDRNVHRQTTWTQHRARRMRRKSRGIIPACALALALLAVVVGLTLDWLLVFLLASAVAIVGGVTGIATGLVARRGRRLTCARCGYAMGSWRAAAERCPECGSDWRRPWRHTIGERRVSWPSIGCSVLAVFAGTAMQSIAIAMMMK